MGEARETHRSWFEREYRKVQKEKQMEDGKVPLKGTGGEGKI